MFTVQKYMMSSKSARKRKRFNTASLLILTMSLMQTKDCLIVKMINPTAFNQPG